MDKPIAEIKDRLKKALSIREMTPKELSAKTGIPKSSISQYMSGYAKPKQDRIFLISKALNINEAWLIGFDVPMERNDYEDQNILRFDIEFENAINIIQDEGYSVSFIEDSYNNYFIIKNKDHEIVAQMYDYELVNKYESLLRKNVKSITAKDLLFNDEETQRIIDKVFAFDSQLKVLGWTYKIISEVDSHKDKRPVTYALFKKGNVTFKVSGDDYDSLMNDSLSFMEERLQKLFLKNSAGLFDSASEIKAAHERTDIEVTDEMRKHDDDIMNDPDF